MVGGDGNLSLVVVVVVVVRAEDVEQDEDDDNILVSAAGFRLWCGINVVDTSGGGSATMPCGCCD